MRLLGLALAMGLALVVVVVGARGSAAEADAPADAPATVSFRVVDLYVESDRPLAAYQLEVSAEQGDAVIVGVEGGEAPLDAPPFYDPAALEGGRIILAAFNTDKALPPGKHRVASLHMRESSMSVHYTAFVRAAADSAGQRHEPRAFVEPRPEVSR